jgi:hypothetical protein
VLPIDLSGKSFGQLTVLELLQERGRRGERLWRCRCSCGKETTVRAALLLQGRTKSCGCLRVTAPIQRRKDLTGETFGFLEVLGLAEERTSEGRLLWRCRCIHKRRDGEQCGREVLAPGRQLQSGWRKSCGHHRKGRFRKTLAKKCKIARRIEAEGEGWILPSKAAKLLGLARLRRDRVEGIRWRSFSTGFGGSLPYVSETDVHKKADQRTQRETLPQVDDHLGLASSAKELKRSVNHVRLVARTVLGETLPTFAAKDEYGRSCVKTYVPLAVHEKLKAHFAGAPIPEPDPAPVAIPAAETAPQEEAPRKQRGRPRGAIDERAHARKEEIVADWRARRYASISALARAHHVTRSYASRILKAAGTEEA